MSFFNFFMMFNQSIPCFWMSVQIFFHSIVSIIQFIIISTFQLENLININLQQQLQRMKTGHPSLQERMPLLNPIYPAEYEKIYLEVLGRVNSQDFSQKTNQLIQKLITFGQTNYSCWVAKKWILNSGSTTIQHEDKYSEQVLYDNQKNFQVWDYRNFIYDNTHNHQRQYEIMDKILEHSPKNYHLWSNRTRLVGIVKNYSQQIARTQKFIIRDTYNNSAWTYRAFCFERLLVKDYETQFEFVSNQIKNHVDNEAAWNYLRGYFPCYTLRNLNSQKYLETQKKLKLSYQDYPKIKQLCKEIIEKVQIGQHEKVQALITILIMDSHKEETVQYAKQVCLYLSQIEPIRANFYLWLKDSL